MAGNGCDVKSGLEGLRLVIFGVVVTPSLLLATFGIIMSPAAVFGCLRGGSVGLLRRRQLLLGIRRQLLRMGALCFL